VSSDDAPENVARCANFAWAFCEPVATLLLAVAGKAGSPASHIR
jgi:hypothetical protein